ncbi:MAG: YjjG family noncanonical pyrimidine nucleotidase [Clostridia bacterium]|nr:YjjG family noncanonical pyrimidine nucleotidase [Clostridia bacterium]
MEITVLWDIDGTLLDFKAAERGAVPALFARFGLGECTDEMLAAYSDINEKQWERLERGEAPKQEILVERFRLFFSRYGIDTGLAPAFNAAYQPMLGEFVSFIPGALETVTELKNRGVRQYAVTNGTKQAQTKKLAVSGLAELFDGVFISEDVGFEKPDTRYFDLVLTAIGVTDRKRVMIVGDSLTSDMKGGCAAGLITCRFDPAGRTDDTDLPIDYTVTSIAEVPRLVAALSGN